MTNYKNTDKIIKSKYDSVESAFDAELIWSELAPQIERKRRRGFFFWAFSGVAIIALSLVSFNLFNQDSITQVVEGDSRVDKSISEISDRSPITKSSIVLQGVNSAQLSMGDKHVDSQNTNVKEGQSEVVKSSSTISSKTVFKSKFFTNEENFSLDKKSIYKSTIRDRFIEESNSLKNESRGDVTSFDAINYNRNLISILEIPTYIVSSLDYEMKKVVHVNSEMVERPSKQPLLKNQWRIGINGGYYIHSRTFDNAGDDISSNNYSSRSQEEKAKDGYDLGVKLEYFLSDHFVIIGGLRFSQSFVQRKADYAYTETITLVNHVVEIINTEQGPIEVKENITYDGVFIHKADNYITATRLGLITGIQYRVGIDRWTTHVDLGIELPVWSSHSGIITNNQRPYNLSDKTEVINASSLQVFGGIGMEYTLSSTTALQATIGGYMPLKNEHVESYTIEKKSALLGLNIGVHFRL